MHRLLLVFLGFALACSANPSITTSKTASPNAGGAPSITTEDLHSRLSIYAHDSMMGREAWTEGNYKATAYLAEQVRRLGLEPAGEKGTYFQEVPHSLNRRGGGGGAKPAAVARNVIAILRGSDPVLRNEYVAIGAHNDHIGIRKAGPVNGDSIYNGADDDGSGSVALLEIAEAFAHAPVKPRRSIIFVWHTAEEKGLLGAQHFTDNPTVPLDAIIAQLNMDMIGRGGLDTLYLVGSRRLSTQLGDIIEVVNKDQSTPLTLDYTLDANGHRENLYCRSDHYMYARYGIPVTFFFTGLHADYHKVSDEVQKIDFPKLASVTRLVHDITKNLANQNSRPIVDKPKPDPKAPCQQ